MDNMLNFPCRATIYANDLLTSLNTGNSNIFLWKQWFIEKQIPIVPFNDTRYILKKVPGPLTHQHSRLLIEYFLLLAPGDKIVCLISKKQK